MKCWLILNAAFPLCKSVYIFIKCIVMQQHQQQFTLVNTFGFIFRPSSDHASFRLDEKLYNRPNVKIGRRLVPMIQMW
jgi:hypothetical protein